MCQTARRSRKNCASAVVQNDPVHIDVTTDNLNLPKLHNCNRQHTLRPSLNFDSKSHAREKWCLGEFNLGRVSKHLTALHTSYFDRQCGKTCSLVSTPFLELRRRSTTRSRSRHWNSMSDPRPSLNKQRIEFREAWSSVTTVAFKNFPITSRKDDFLIIRMANNKAGAFRKIKLARI